MAQFSATGGGQVEADTWLSSGSETAGRMAAGAVVGAVGDVLVGKTVRAFCLVRPPGHHARPADPMGFCLYGSIAVGAADAVQRHGLNRILIVDWDVHHGNGTQEIFYNNPEIAFFFDTPLSILSRQRRSRRDGDRPRPGVDEEYPDQNGDIKSRLSHRV